MGSSLHRPVPCIARELLRLLHGSADLYGRPICTIPRSLLPFAAGLVLAAPGTARAASCPDPPPPGTLAATASDLADRIVDAWLPALANRNGTFQDYVAKPGEVKRDHYGPAMLGAALVLDGMRTCRSGVVHAGLRAIDWAALHPPLKDGSERPGVIFENLALAVAYQEAHGELAGDPVYEEVRPDWEARMRHMRFRVYGYGRAYYNWYLVETLTAAALLQSGLTSDVRGTILARPARSQNTITEYLNSVVLRKAGDQTTLFGPQAVLLLSDPPDNPPAYHEFSLALFAKSVALLGPDAEESARTVLDRMGRATWALMAPDGDVSWFGRSQEQSWTLAMTAAGLLTTSRVKGILRPDADRLRAAAGRALERLASRDYYSRRYGIWIAPALDGPIPGAGIGGLDRYAAASSYTGLTLLGLDWVAEDPNAAGPTPDVGIGADTPDLALRLARTGAFIVMRSGPTWMAVKQAPATERDYRKDLRYASGLNGLEVLHDGTWDRILPPRPRTPDRPVTPAGPVVRVGHSIGRPRGRTLEAEHGTIVMQADYFTALGHRVAANRIVRAERRMRSRTACSRHCCRCSFS